MAAHFDREARSHVIKGHTQLCYDRFKIQNHGLGTLVLLDYGNHARLAAGQLAFPGDPHRHFRSCHRGSAVGSALQTHPKSMALGNFQFTGLDRRLHSFNNLFFFNHGTPEGPNPGWRRWRSAMVPS